MLDLYKQLITDHVNLSHILDLLDSEVMQCDIEDWANPNYPLILDSLDYIKNYSEIFHHPLEEAAFDYLIENGLGDVSVIFGIREQHLDLEKETAALQEKLSVATNYCEKPNAFDIRRFRDYVGFQREHIQTENKHIFPVLETLSKLQWLDIGTQVALLRDPIFDSPTRREFVELFKHIDKDNLSFVENA